MQTRLLALLAATLLMACGKNQVIGDRHDTDGDEITADDDEPELDGDGTDGDSDGDSPDGDDPGDDGTDGVETDGGTPEGLPACEGELQGENSCEACCIVEGDILAWCQDLDCTACQDDGQEVEPGATASVGCNVCTCNRDGSVSCTDNDCDIDCNASPDACTWRSGSAYEIAYDRGDGYGVYHSPLWGAWVSKPGTEQVELSQQQIMELYDLVLSDAQLRDFVRNGAGDCPAIDRYWSQLRSERPVQNIQGSISLTLDLRYTRMLSADCTVSALVPLSNFVDRVAQ
jgi:hypothetical protein